MGAKVGQPGFNAGLDEALHVAADRLIEVMENPWASRPLLIALRFLPLQPGAHIAVDRNGNRLGFAIGLLPCIQI